jgi:hypothetical protein
MIGVSERTLLRRRVEYSLPVGVTFTDITDGDLDVAIRGIAGIFFVGACMYHHNNLHDNIELCLLKYIRDGSNMGTSPSPQSAQWLLRVVPYISTWVLTLTCTLGA